MRDNAAMISCYILYKCSYFCHSLWCMLFAVVLYFVIKLFCVVLTVIISFMDVFVSAVLARFRCDVCFAVVCVNVILFVCLGAECVKKKGPEGDY